MQLIAYVKSIGKEGAPAAGGGAAPAPAAPAPGASPTK